MTTQTLGRIKHQRDARCGHGDYTASDLAKIIVDRAVLLAALQEVIAQGSHRLSATFPTSERDREKIENACWQAVIDTCRAAIAKATGAES